MEPRPRPRRDELKGSGRLRGRKALITGRRLGRSAGRRAIAFAREGVGKSRQNYLPQWKSGRAEVDPAVRSDRRDKASRSGDIKDEAFWQSSRQQAVQVARGTRHFSSTTRRGSFFATPIADISTAQSTRRSVPNSYAMSGSPKPRLPHYHGRVRHHQHGIG